MKRGRRGETRKLNARGLVLHLKIQEEEGEEEKKNRQSVINKNKKLQPK